MDFDKAIDIAFGACSDAQLRRRAEEYLEQCQSAPAIWMHLMNLLRQGLHTQRPEVAFWCCKTLSSVIPTKPLGPPETSEVTELLFGWMQKVLADGSIGTLVPYIRSMFAQVVGVLYQKLWPESWPSFWPTLLQLCKASPGPATFDMFLRLAQAVDDYAASSRDAVNGNVQHHLLIRKRMHELQAVHRALETCVSVLQSCAATHTDVCVQCLEVLRRYADWADLDAFASCPALVAVLWDSATVPALACEACAVLLQLLGRIDATTAAVLPRLELPDRLPQLLTAAWPWIGSADGATCDDDAYLREDYRAKVAGLGTVVCVRLLDFARADGGAQSPAGAAVQSCFAWVFRLMRLDLRTCESEQHALWQLYSALLTDLPESAGGRLLQEVWSTPARTPSLLCAFNQTLSHRCAGAAHYAA